MKCYCSYAERQAGHKPHCPYTTDQAKGPWRLCEADPGSDVGVTCEPYSENEPDGAVLSVHVWHAGTDQCVDFARKLCDALNQAKVPPLKVSR